MMMVFIDTRFKTVGDHFSPRENGNASFNSSCNESNFMLVFKIETERLLRSFTVMVMGNRY